MAFSGRKIIHVDMDCFYAAVEVKHRPELRGKALGIGGPPNTRSVLCTASYEARKFGVHSAMPTTLALKLCPTLLLIPPNFSLYKKESEAVREILRRFSPTLEPLSLDEAYLDVTDSPLHGGSATLIAEDIRSTIFRELQLTASAGVAPNKFLAKIASDWKKPNGLFVIRPEEVAAFVETLSIEKIHGVGKVTTKKMHELGYFSCADLQKSSIDDLTKHFGSRGEDLHRLAHGIDSRPVDGNSERKSLTVEETFRRDMKTLEGCLMSLRELYSDWELRMKRFSNSTDRIRGFVVKVKYFDFKNTSREVSSKKYPLVTDFEELFTEVWKKRSDPVRLLGLGVRLGAAESEPEIPYQLKLGLAI